LYSSHLSNWRQEVEAMELAALQSKPRGPKPDTAKAADRRVLNLEQENAKLRRQLGRAEQIIDVQKTLRSSGLADGGRSAVMTAASGLVLSLGAAAACKGMGVSGATYYRAKWPRSALHTVGQPRRSPLALGPAERQQAPDLRLPGQKQG
jgi:hypothetical protein